MANHVTNRLTVSTPSVGYSSTLLDFRIQANKFDPDYHKSEFTEAPDYPYRLSFWNFKRPDREMMDEYNDSSVGARNGWYNWNSRNWGTKWDAYDVRGTNVYSGPRHWLRYDFTTANAAPVLVMEQMMAMFPKLIFTLQWQDEAGPGGEFRGADGIWHETDRFTGATSHTEATEPRRLVKCQCLVTDGEYTPFPDCPAASK